MTPLERHATAPKKLGAFFFNPGVPLHLPFMVSFSCSILIGGPGGSGVEAISESGQASSQAFQSAFNTVSWDPRGVGYTL